MLQEIVGAGEVFESVGFFPQTVIHHSTVMRDGRRRRPVRFLLARLRFIELFQRCLEGMRTTPHWTAPIAFSAMTIATMSHCASCS